MKQNNSIMPNERVFIAGKTGSGKTKLAEVYLAGYDNVIALDTKGMLNWTYIPDVEIFETLEDLMKFKEGKAIYRPNIYEQNEEYYNSFFEWIYRRRNTIVWIDELMSLNDTGKPLFWYKGLLTRGRELNIGVWSLTQRPKTIPLCAMSEADHFFIFQLQMFDDRKRVNEVIGCPEIVNISPSKHSFWYYRDGWEKPVMGKLKLKKEDINNGKSGS